MTMHIKHAAFDMKRAPDDDGVFEGYASVFDVLDLGMDIVAPGAFTKSLASGRRIKMLWQHSMADPIGVWDEVREDERGLYVKGRLLDAVQKGREATALLRAKAIDGMSIGYRTVESIAEANGRVRKLTEIELHEISIVTNPMLPVAVVTAIKSITTEREFEAFLRDAGYSRKEATAVALHGFKGLNNLRDAGSDDGDSGAKALLQSLEKLKGAFHV